jgi:hypothetical protein
MGAMDLMRFQPSLLWTWKGTIDRLPYVLTGVSLFLVKFAIDWVIATRLFGQVWSLTNYFIWPNDRTLRVFDLSDPQRLFALTMLAISLPFVWTGVILTLHRLRAAGLPLAMVVFFFVPLVNLLLFLVLSLLPTREVRSVESTAVQEVRRLHTLRQTHRRLARDSYWRSGLIALAVAVPLAVLCVYLGGVVLGNYGFSLFLGGPFALGMIVVLLFGLSKPQPFGACVLVALAAAASTGLALFAFMMEGMICLILASPIILFFVFVGAVVGYIIQTRPWLSDETGSLLLALLAALPGLMAAESADPLGDTDRSETIISSVILHAEPEQIWDALIATEDVSAEKPLLLHFGLPVPTRCSLDGSGVGATRTCYFDSGVIEERVTVWDPPRRFEMDIERVTLPGRHWLRFKSASYLMERLSPNETRVTRTTSISSQLRPAWYWRPLERMGVEAEHEYLFKFVAASLKQD